jgi:hypothetical protein
MEYEIKRKLTKLLIKGIAEEADVVYFLVEARKLIDRRNLDAERLGGQKYENQDLRMYANWIAHASLRETRSANLALLRCFEQEFVSSRDQGRPWATTAYEMFLPLKQCLSDFFVWAGIDQQLTDLITDDLKWQRFLLAYYQVMCDCPISIKEERDRLPNVAEVSLMEGQPLETRDGRTFFGVSWVVIAHDGKKYRFRHGVESLGVESK